MLKWLLISAIVIGALLLWKPAAEFLETDRCLDSGGAMIDGKCRTSTSE